MAICPFILGNFFLLFLNCLYPFGIKYAIITGNDQFILLKGKDKNEK